MLPKFAQEPWLFVDLLWVFWNLWFKAGCMKCCPFLSRIFGCFPICFLFSRVVENSAKFCPFFPRTFGRVLFFGGGLLRSSLPFWLVVKPRLFVYWGPCLWGWWRNPRLILLPLGLVVKPLDYVYYTLVKPLVLHQLRFPTFKFLNCGFRAGGTAAHFSQRASLIVNSYKKIWINIPLGEFFGIRNMNFIEYMRWCSVWGVQVPFGVMTEIIQCPSATCEPRGFQEAIRKILEGSHVTEGIQKCDPTTFEGCHPKDFKKRNKNSLYIRANPKPFQGFPCHPKALWSESKSFIEVHLSPQGSREANPKVF